MINQATSWYVTLSIRPMQISPLRIVNYLNMCARARVAFSAVVPTKQFGGSSHVETSTPLAFALWPRDDVCVMLIACMSMRIHSYVCSLKVSR